MVNFCPNVKCPKCGHVAPVAISGFGREGLNRRLKTCSKCGADFVVSVFVQTDLETDTTDGHIASLEASIRYHKSFLKKSLQEKSQILNRLKALTRTEREEIELLLSGASASA